MHDTEVKAALIAAVQALNLPLLQVENVSTGRLDPTKPWYRATVLPARTVHATVGIGGLERLAGILQVDVFVPTGKGTELADTSASTTIDAFAPRTRIAAAGDTIVIDRSYLLRASTFEGFYQLPVHIEWWVHTHRT